MRRCDPTRVMTSSFLRFLYHTQRRITVGRIPLDEWSARRRDLYLTKRNTHNRQTSIPPVGFEPTISAGERPWTYALDRAATRIGKYIGITLLNLVNRAAVVYGWPVLHGMAYSLPAVCNKILKFGIYSPLTSNGAQSKSYAGVGEAMLPWRGTVDCELRFEQTQI
jgi:hypothetical protein